MNILPDMQKEFTVDSPAGPRTFRLREYVSPDAARFIQRHDARLRSIIAASMGASDADRRDAGMQIIKLFLPSTETANRTMRFMVAGDHTGIDWANDVDFVTAHTIAVTYMFVINEWLRTQPVEMVERLAASLPPMDASAG